MYTILPFTCTINHKVHELLDFQGSPPPCWKTGSPDEQEVKHAYQETCTDEQGAPDDIPSIVSMHFFTSEIRGRI